MQEAHSGLYSQNLSFYFLIFQQEDEGQRGKKNIYYQFCKKYIHGIQYVAPRYIYHGRYVSSWVYLPREMLMLKRQC